MHTSTLGLWWVDLGWLPHAEEAALSLPLLNSKKSENAKNELVEWHKDREITYQLLSQAKQTWLEKG